MPRGEILSEISTQCFDRLYGRVWERRKQIHDWDSTGGCVIVTLDETEFQFEIYGKELGGVRAGTTETLEYGKETVEKELRRERAAKKDQ